MIFAFDALEADFQHSGYSAVSWAVLFSQWRKKEGQFRDQAEATTQKRPADQRETPSPPGKRRKALRYDEAEEREMARYILSRLPNSTRTSPLDWEEFARDVG